MDHQLASWLSPGERLGIEIGIGVFVLLLAFAAYKFLWSGRSKRIELKDYLNEPKK